MSRKDAALFFALGAALSVAAPAAHAKNFVIVDISPGSWTILDPLGVEATGGGVVQRTWTVQILRNITNAIPGQPGYVRTQTDYDCQRREFRWREFSAFSRSGDALVTKQNPAYHWESVDKAPDTLNAYRVACGQSMGRGVISADSVAKLVITIMASWDPPARPAAPAPKLPAAKPPPKAAASKPPAKRQLSTRDLWP